MGSTYALHGSIKILIQVSWVVDGLQKLQQSLKHRALKNFQLVLVRLQYAFWGPWVIPELCKEVPSSLRWFKKSLWMQRILRAVLEFLTWFPGCLKRFKALETFQIPEDLEKVSCVPENVTVLWEDSRVAWKPLMGLWGGSSSSWRFSRGLASVNRETKQLIWS